MNLIGSLFGSLSNTRPAAYPTSVQAGASTSVKPLDAAFDAQATDVRAGDGQVSDEQVSDGQANEITPQDVSDARPRPRSTLANTVMATLAVVAALWWGKNFMIPVTVGIMLSLLVMPLTARLELLIHSRVVAATVSMLLVIALLVMAATAFGGQLARVAGRVPDMISLVAQRLSQTDPGASSVLTRARSAFQDLDRAADRITGFNPLKPGPVPPSSSSGRKVVAAKVEPAPTATPEAPPVSLSQTATVALRETAVIGSSVLLKFATDMTVIFFISFFVLAGVEPMARRYLEIWGDEPERRHRAKCAAQECIRQIRIYGGVLLVTNTIIGIAVWGAFSVSGLPDAAGWGITAAVLHVVPYLGMALLTGLGAAETFLAHGTLGSAAGMAAFLVILSTLIGTVVTAWLQGRAAKMNATAVFVGVVFWGALWGVWGLLLGPALAVLIKVVAENSRSSQWLARLMQG